MHDNVNGWEADKKDRIGEKRGMVGPQETHLQLPPISPTLLRLGRGCIALKEEPATFLPICSISSDLVHYMGTPEKARSTAAQLVSAMESR
jgi:hypothetical protein